MNPTDKFLFLKSLQAEGIEEVYLPAERKPAEKAAEGNRSQPGLAAADQKAVQDPSSRRSRMLNLKERVAQCLQCQELAATRNKTVLGSGNLKADLVFVGEAPGREEDEQGLPFVGAAGQLLTKIIEAMGYTRNQVFICNVLKCRPPGNRAPLPEEVRNCGSFLREQLEIIRPKMICALGNHAAHALLATQQPMNQLRGKIHSYENIPLVCTYHPAYLLRNPADKGKVWEDMKMIKRELEKRTAS